ncbi:MAG TPA: GNAT family N-acetyltransferase [Gaiellaceae bacterium]|nr:GNAT family N-acetyltransferase [Gaiellaceae bacterium]
MRVEVRAAQPGEGAGLAEVWLENARYYVDLFPDDFRMPDELGLAESIEERLAASASASQLRLVALVDGVVAAFVSARLIDPDEGAAREMLADRVHRRVHIEALGTANAFQRQGLATRLVEAVEAWAREHGARFISAGTYLESPVAIPFWEQRMGYRRRMVIIAKRLD